jgi:sugar/nucleoside kinase (ribokinase family)
MPPMLVVGSVAFDTLHLPNGSHEKVLGGSATYAALAGSIFTPAQLVGVVGRDYPDSAVKLLREHNIDLEGLESRDGLTFHWEGRYANDLTSRTSLKTELNVFAEFHPKIPERFRSTPYVMLGNIGPDLQLEVLAQVKKPKLVIADTMNYWIETKLADLKRLLKQVDVLVVNDEEARQLAQTYNIALVAQELLAMGAAQCGDQTRRARGHALARQGRVLRARVSAL